MGLTNEERRRLDELAGDLAAQDPRLARALSDNANLPPNASRQRLSSNAWGLTAVMLSGLAMPVLVLGVVLHAAVLIGFGFTALLSGPLIVTVRRSKDRNQPPN